MPPKKREKDGESSKNPRIDHIQVEHDLFLQAFEKPTQIYRYLSIRNMLSPIFINRTLSYMRHRMSRAHKSRQGFKVDTILERVLTAKRNNLPKLIQPGYLNLNFFGFYDKQLESHPPSVEVEVVLLKISHKKRKESSSPVMQISLGTVLIPINPAEDSVSALAPTISIPTESFNLSNGNFAKSYMLLFRVQCSRNNTNDNDDEPNLKRKKSTNNMIKVLDESKIYGTELIIYDKHNRCLLSTGNYELTLEDLSSIKSSSRNCSNWETINDITDTYLPDNLSKEPVLKFKLLWTEEPTSTVVDIPKPYSFNDYKETLPSAQFQVVYQFLYNNNSRQQTQASENLLCPWCNINCLLLYSLLKHLKLCHSRFNFTYVPIAKGARIDVTINELYDGSYAGSPHDLITQPTGYAFSRNGPVRRASVTHILVFRPKRSKPNLSEFLELDDVEYDGQRPYITGHNRLYHHTTTCLAIYPKEMDADSEDENDPEWLRTKTTMMIDEFTDVNEGEKELMKMWNLHVMKYGFVGDCQIPLACVMFVQTKGREILLKKLFRNFLMHVCNLYDFGLINPGILHATIIKLLEMAKECAEIQTVLFDSYEMQLIYWLQTRVFQQPNQERSVSINKTPNRKSTLGGPAQPRRKGTPSVELRQKAGGETSRKRLSLSLKKEETQGKALSN